MGSARLFPGVLVIGQRSAHRHLGAHLDENCASTVPGSKFSISIAPFCVSTTATMSPRVTLIARLDQPLDQRSRFHVGAERRHAELGHEALPLGFSQRRFRHGDDFGTGGDGRLFQMPG